MIQTINRRAALAGAAALAAAPVVASAKNVVAFPSAAAGPATDGGRPGAVPAAPHRRVGVELASLIVAMASASAPTAEQLLRLGALTGAFMAASATAAGFDKAPGSGRPPVMGRIA